MILALINWLGRSLGILLLAFALALIVWFFAVINANPSMDCEAPREIPLEILGQDTNLLILSDIPVTIDILLRAPSSLCDLMNEETGSILASIDLSGLGEGQHNVPVNVPIPEKYSPVRLLDKSLETVSVTLEAFQMRDLPLNIEITGEPAPGYTAGIPILSDSRVTYSGRRSLVEQIADATVSLDITDAQGDIERNNPVLLLDAEGNPVTGVTMEPVRVTLTQPIERPGNFRNVTVRVKNTGQVADGYQLRNITVSPQVVTVSSPDPQLVREMPGFVETILLDLTDATDDIERRLPLELPRGVSIVGEQSVLVQVSIAAVETTVSLSLNVEVIGLPSDLEVEVEPESVDVILEGPVPVLNQLQSEQDVRVFLDLTSLQPDLYRLEPQVEILPLGVRTQSILPITLEVTISFTATPTALPTSTPTPTSEP